MITKFKYIKNLAVFKDFTWDDKEKEGGNVILFKKINILYGHNYSGKTTLSNVVRALETGSISDKYEDPECCVCITGNPDVTEANFKNHSKTIRVFNKDFIEKNLRFIIDPNGNVEPFAILGEGNNDIEEEINDLKTKLGSNEEDNKTGLYKDLASIEAFYQAAEDAHLKAQESLNDRLRNKAVYIKNKTGLYNDVNYDITKIKTDIETVNENTYSPLTDEGKDAEEKILKEESKGEISESDTLTLGFLSLHAKAKELVTREIVQSNKIQELVKNAVLNRWVKEGKTLHQNKLSTCSFCNNPISESRWLELDRHFDEELEELERDIDRLLEKVKNERLLLENFSIYAKDQVYSKFYNDLETAKKSFKNERINYTDSLKSIEKQLENRKENILNKKVFIEEKDFSFPLEDAIKKLDEVRINSNNYSDQLNNDQIKAKNNLRLKEVYDFINTISYDELIANIGELETKKNVKKAREEKKQNDITNISNRIHSKEVELKDESKGADKVNEYLNHYFGHKFLTIKAVKVENEDTDNQRHRFEIHREDKKAYHLSEGEKSLIAFCYFVAKLQDIETKDEKPIIWIDDPISSLDNNHIFFIYSLINTKICGREHFEQLFISTHSLEFLKFLRRLPNAINDIKKKEKKRMYEYLIIERINSNSTINIMPKFLRDYVTEFNYLFSQIQKCVKSENSENLDDSDYSPFYNFGNNARKFLEIYLFYKYPDSTSQIEKIKKFFDSEDISPILIDKINNEYSHASNFERGNLPFEASEMKKAAKLIIRKIKEKDKDQYNALVESVKDQDSRN